MQLLANGRRCPLLYLPDLQEDPTKENLELLAGRNNYGLGPRPRRIILGPGARSMHLLDLTSSRPPSNPSCYVTHLKT